MSDNNYDTLNTYSLMRIKRQKRKRIVRIRILIICLIIIGGIIAVSIKGYDSVEDREKVKVASEIKIPSWIDVKIINKHGSARTGTKLSAINNIVIHYVGNPGTTAMNNRNYFNKDDTNVSSHFVVGLEGEIVQCVPISEKSAASNWRNSDTISIEVCHPDETGEFNENTYASVIKLAAWLCDTFGLKETDLIRHYDITEKECPLYYVENEDKWKQLKKDVGEKLNDSKTTGKTSDSKTEKNN